MRLITDFDGVWTDPIREARVIDGVIEAELARESGLEPAEIRRRLEPLRAEVRAAPERHGWTTGGCISAYADEDPFCFQSGVHALLARSGADELEPLVRALEALGGPGPFGARCYELGVQRAIAAHGPPIHAGARATLERLLELFEEVVVVSNSAPEKLVASFEHVGVRAGAGAHERLRLRGHARKYALRPEPPPPGGAAEREFAGRAVRLDRGHYHELLRDEQPDVVIGDVFSLDLALPLALRAAEPALAGLELALLETAATPAWTRAVVAQEARLHLVSSLDELAGIARRP